MVVPSGNIANKLIFPSNLSTTIMSCTTINDSTFPTMSSMTGIGMGIQAGQGPVTNSEVRGRNISPSVNLSRESSLASSGRSTPYHDRIDTDADFPLSREVSNFELSYEAEQEKAQQVSMVANQQVL